MDIASQLKDIKPIVEVVDHSLYYFSAIVLIIVVLISVILYKYFNRIKPSKKPTQKQLILQKLQNLDYNDTKDVIYSFSVDLFPLINEDKKEQYETIVSKLSQYKYKKEIEQLSEQLKQEIQQFIKGIK